MIKDDFNNRTIAVNTDLNMEDIVSESAEAFLRIAHRRLKDGATLEAKELIDLGKLVTQLKFGKGEGFRETKEENIGYVLARAIQASRKPKSLTEYLSSFKATVALTQENIDILNAFIDHVTAPEHTD